jgi:hypothetical protein
MQLLPALRRPRTALAVLGAVAAAAAFTTLPAHAAGARTAAPQATAAAATAMPAHVYSPYFEAYNGDNPATLSTQSGAKYLTFAFLQTASAGSCTAYWNGDSGMPVSSSTFGSQIASIQAAGGNVVPSFGGYAADDGGTDIADSCTNVNSIAAAYESVITTYNVSRVDLDVEDNSLNNTAGITRRNEAVAQVESWAASNGRTVSFSYTLPTNTNGLDANGLAVLQNAVSHGATVGVANIMTFDYYVGSTQEMGTDTETAAQGLYNQLATLYPGKTSAQLWGMIGVTEMPGIDDYGKPETFTTADATTVESWAVSKGIAELSIWALQRDNGGCVGTGGSDSCSGVSQSTWQFSHTFEPFTSGGGGGGTTPPSTGAITGYQGLCLDDRSASTANSNPVQVYTCNGTTAQSWTVNASSNTLTVLGKCLDVHSAGTANGTLVDLYACNGTGAQTWVPQSNHELLNPASGKCLDDTGYGGSGTQVQIWTCGDTSNQQWTVP